MGKNILFLTTLSIVLFLSGCSEKRSVDNSVKAVEENDATQLIEGKNDQISELEEKNEELQNSLESIKTDLNYSKEEAVYYKNFIDDLTSDYSEAQLISLAKEMWDYELEVNGLSIPRDGVIEVKGNTIEISLVQKQPAYVVLPNEIFMQGKISGNYNEHIEFNDSPTETYMTDGTIVTGVHNKFENLDKGSTISFSITEELKKRLELDVLEVEVKTN